MHGGVVDVPKKRSHYSFMRALASNRRKRTLVDIGNVNQILSLFYLIVSTSMWVGLRMRRPLGTFDLAAAEAGENPLVWEEDEVWTYSDGSPFDKDINYDMEISSFSTYECVILRSSSSFAARVTRCGGKLYPFICKWKGTRVKLKIPTFLLTL